MSNRVIHFEIHVTDPARAQAFYKKLFDWQFVKWDGPLDFWHIITGDAGTPGINGAMVKRMGSAPAVGAPASAFICTVQVDSVDATVGAALASGGVVALDKMAVPGVAWIAYVIDPEGNVFGLRQEDTNAK